MVGRTLNSDELGEKGEKRFGEICADAHLICNSSTRDRAGWDFIVEFPLDSPVDQPLDKRKPPISCHVQLKTVWTTSTTFEMRLSSAERLAKELKPAFVYVFTVNEKLEFVDGYLVHILDEVLAVILKRLRQEEAAGTRAEINKKFIKMTVANVGTRIPPTGAALRQKIETVCGLDPHGYVENKRKQVEELGFEPRPYEGQMTLSVAGKDELLDAFYGLKPLKVVQLSTFETRFGIKLPVEPSSFSSGTVSFDPKPQDQCTITYRRKPLTPPAMFRGDVFFAPPIGKAKELNLFIKAGLFAIRYSDPTFEFTYNFNPAEMPPQSLLEWRNILTLTAGLAAGEGQITIQPKQVQGSIPLHIPGKLFDADPQIFEFLTQASISLTNILAQAGSNTEARISFQDLESLAEAAVTLEALLAGRSEDVMVLSFSTARHGPLDASLKETTFAHVNFLEIGSERVGYTLVAQMEPTLQEDSIDWTSGPLEPFDIRILDKSRASFEAYAEEMQKATRAEGLMKRETEDSDE